MKRALLALGFLSFVLIFPTLARAEDFGMRVVPLAEILPLGRMVCERMDVASKAKDPTSAKAAKFWEEHVGAEGEKLKGVDLTRPIAGYLAGDFTLAIPVKDERAFLEGLARYGCDDPWKGPEATYVWVVPGYKAVVIGFRDGYAHLAARPGNAEWPSSVEEPLALAKSYRTVSLVYQFDMGAKSDAKATDTWFAGAVRSALAGQIAQLSLTVDLDRKGRILIDGSTRAISSEKALFRSQGIDKDPQPGFAPVTMPGRVALRVASLEDATALQVIEKMLPTIEPAVGKKNVSRFTKLLKSYAGNEPPFYLQAHSSPADSSHDTDRSLLACLHVSDGRKLEADFLRGYQAPLVEEPALRLHAARSAEGRWIHAIDVPATVDPLSKASLPATTFYFGCGAQSFLMATGQESLEVLRRALDAPRPQQTTQLVVHGSVSAFVDWMVSQAPEGYELRKLSASMRTLHAALFDQGEREFVQLTTSGGKAMSMRLETNVSSAVFMGHHAKELGLLYGVYTEQKKAWGKK